MKMSAEEVTPLHALRRIACRRSPVCIASGHLHARDVPCVAWRAGSPPPCATPLPNHSLMPHVVTTPAPAPGYLFCPSLCSILSRQRPPRKRSPSSSSVSVCAVNACVIASVSKLLTVDYATEDRRDALSWVLNVLWVFNGGLQTAALW